MDMVCHGLGLGLGPGVGVECVTNVLQPTYAACNITPTTTTTPLELAHMGDACPIAWSRVQNTITWLQAHGGLCWCWLLVLVLVLLLVVLLL